MDVPGVEQYRCQNHHLVSFDVKFHRVIRVILPFEDLKTCPTCGLPVAKIADQTTETRTNGEEDGKGLVRLAYYVCEEGHQTPKRQIVQRNLLREAFG